jgi:hypothetical protein
VAVCSRAFFNNPTKLKKIDPKRLLRLKRDRKFVEAAQSRTTGSGNVRDRINAAIKYLGK